MRIPQDGYKQRNSLTTVPLLFENLPDKIVVSVFGYGNQGKEFFSTNELSVILYKSKNQYDFPLKGTWSVPSHLSLVYRSPKVFKEFIRKENI